MSLARVLAFPVLICALGLGGLGVGINEGVKHTRISKNYKTEEVQRANELQTLQEKDITNENFELYLQRGQEYHSLLSDSTVRNDFINYQFHNDNANVALALFFISSAVVGAGIFLGRNRVHDYISRPQTYRKEKEPSQKV